MFDLRVPESMASLPGRKHECMDDALSVDERQILRELNADDSAKRKFANRFDYLLYVSVMSELKQCKCGETAYDRMLKSEGRVRHLCKACNTKQAKEWYAKHGRKIKSPYFDGTYRAEKTVLR